MAFWRNPVTGNPYKFTATQEQLEDCCCEPVIDPDKWYCVNESGWMNDTCDGEPSYSSDLCIPGSDIIQFGIAVCNSPMPGESWMINYIISGPYDTGEACMIACKP